jgi:polyphosphate kinase 2 (PPK2 family)
VLRRLEGPDKYWKFSAGDAREGNHWRDYMRVYEDMIRNTSSPHAPWYVVPGDNKWCARLVVASAVIDAMEEMSLAYPKVDRKNRQELRAARAAFGAQL